MKHIDKEGFIRVCNEAVSAASAARQLNMHFNTFKRYAILFGCYITNQSHKGVSIGPRKNGIKTDDILAGLYPDYQTYKLKRRLIREGYIEDRCNRCGWNGKVVGAEFTPCELHHKDGNSHNHSLDNLELICPNCHSLTPNYRAKNKK